METSSQTFARLLAALEDLVNQEATQVAVGDQAGVLQTQVRAAAVIDRLAQLGAGAADRSLRKRITALTAKRRGSQNILAARIKTIGDELSRVHASLQRLALVAPAYRGSVNPTPARQLCSLG